MRRPSQRSLWLGFLALAGLVVHSQLATYTYAQRRVQVQPAPGVPDKALPDKAVPDKTVPQPAFVPELLKKHQQDLAEAAKKVQEAAAKGDLKELEQALRQMQAVLDKVRQGVREIPDQLGPPNVRIIINGQEIKPGDPRFPRIRIVPPGAIPVPPNDPTPLPPGLPKPDDKKPEQPN